MNKVSQPHQSTAGFTIPELLITLVVTTLFIATFYQMFIAINSYSAHAKQRSLADNAAYSLLRQYAAPDISPSTWFTCSTQSGSNNDNDLVVNNAAPGTIVQSGSLSPENTGLPGPVTYTVNALAIFGCAGANAETPVRLQVKLTYGSSNQTITHAVLAAY